MNSKGQTSSDVLYDWTPRADHVDLYSKYTKPSLDGFSEADLGNTINIHDYDNSIGQWNV